MSAQIPDTLLVSEILKPTGFDCPAKLQGKTFAEATAGDSSVTVEALTATENKTYTAPEGKAYSPVTVSVPASGSDIEANKAATIDVSTYTEPVEITPTAGKDGMAKATVTLSNIPSPSGGGATAYAWVPDNSEPVSYLSFDKAPSTLDGAKELRDTTDGGTGQEYKVVNDASFSSYARVDDTHFTKTFFDTVTTYTRDATKDFTLWS